MPSIHDLRFTIYRFSSNPSVMGENLPATAIPVKHFFSHEAHIAAEITDAARTLRSYAEGVK